MTAEADLFRFEVPTSRGKFVVIGPDTLSPDEAERVGAQIGRLIPLLVLPEIDPEHNPGYVMAEASDHPEPRASLIADVIELGDTSPFLTPSTATELA